MFKHIVVPVDGSQGSLKALALGAQLAKEQGARCTVCSVVDIIRAATSMTFASAEVVDAYFTALREDAHAALERALQRVREFEVGLEQRVLEGYPADAIMEFARSESADLMVMGSHGRTGLRRVIMGSVAEEVVRTAAMPVMIVHTPE